MGISMEDEVQPDPNKEATNYYCPVRKLVHITIFNGTVVSKVFLSDMSSKKS